MQAAAHTFGHKFDTKHADVKLGPLSGLDSGDKSHIYRHGVMHNVMITCLLYESSQSRRFVCNAQGAAIIGEAHAGYRSSGVRGFPGAACWGPPQHVGDGSGLCEGVPICLACCGHAQGCAAQTASLPQVSHHCLCSYCLPCMYSYPHIEFQCLDLCAA